MAWSFWVAIIALAILLLCAALVWTGTAKVTFSTFKNLRLGVAVLTIVYAVITVWQLIPAAENPTALSPAAKSLLIGFLIFWVLAPPAWFFFEYFAFESEWITELPAAPGPLPAGANAQAEARKVQLQRVKNYADYASKVWAAVVALFGALVVLR